MVEFEDGTKAVYKGGPLDEIAGEVRNYGEWEKYNPAAVPKVFYSKKEGDDRCSFLMEYIESPNLHELYTQKPEEGRTGTLKAVDELAKSYERSKMSACPVDNYLDKITRKVKQSAEKHEEIADLLKYDTIAINGKEYTNPLKMVEELEKHNHRYKAPFATLTHGDLHARNIHYDQGTGRTYLIDPEKTRFGDYAADVGRLLATTTCNYTQIESASAKDGNIDYQSSLDDYFKNIISDVERKFDNFAEDNFDRGFHDRLELSRASAKFVLPAFSDDKEFSFVSFGEGVKLLDEVYQNTKK
ncbi:MAG: aminoglycoside phosphotransferase family protein [Candidatus Undinarchaeales archaeon]|nr:aminoglycoside phosphotransferase family protein [Candidatus Undinarchaeales archaeon]